MKLLFSILAFVITLLCIPSLVHSQDIEGTQEAIHKLQPAISRDRSAKLAKYIIFHSKEARIDPKLVVAIISRESSFSLAVQTGRRVGKAPLNCVGLMQIAPWGAAHKLGGYLNLADADVNIRTGVMWLEYTHSTCGDTYWQWIAAYGMKGCPSYLRARGNAATITARRLYCKVRENCEEVWPSRRMPVRLKR
jgi:hypothetical protein